MKSVLLPILLLLTSSTFSQDKECDCSKYKTGTFILDNTDGTFSKIERNATTQKETMGKFKTINKIKWINDCSYIIINDKAKGNAKKVNIGDLLLTIVETGEHHYVATIKADFIPQALVVKIYEEGHLNYDQKK